MDKINFIKELLGNKRDYVKGFVYVVTGYIAIILIGNFIWYFK